MRCKDNIGVLDKSVTLIRGILINKNSKNGGNVHIYKTIG
jgi:hypothetical protein